MRSGTQGEEALLKAQRLKAFLRPMLPIAIGFCVLYLGVAGLLRSLALAVGAGAVALFIVTLLLARSRLAQNRPTAAARFIGYGLLAMVAVGAVAIPFLYPALCVMPLAAAAVMLPWLDHRALFRFFVLSLVTVAWVLLFAFLPPLLSPPPLFFQRAVVVAAGFMAAALTLRVFWVDALRLRESVERAEESVRLRDDFLSVASHELNTPLTPLQLRLQTLAKEAQTRPDDPFARDVVVHAHKAGTQVRRLAELVKDLLDVTILRERGLKLRLEPTDLGALTAEVAGRFASEAQRTQTPLHLEVETGLTLLADRRRMDQVVDNLLSNALKYGAGRPVKVSAHSRNGELVVSVSDQGIGIAPESRDRIFNKYERAVSDRHFGGLGLGLYIARQIVEAHSGTITVESQPSQGSTFEVLLPRS